MDDLLTPWNITAVAPLESLSPFWGKTFRVRTAGESYILREMPDRERPAREYALLSCLLQAGAPVGPPVLTCEGSACSQHDGKFYSLYPLLPGDPYKEHYSGDAAGRAGQLGRTIAFFHTCLEGCREIAGFREMNLCGEIENDAITTIHSSSELENAGGVLHIWAEIKPELLHVTHQIPRQLIHRDMHPGNILFEHGELSGWIDFDQVTRGPRIFDLCYCGSSILANGFDDLEKRPAWLELFRLLVSGYESISPLSSLERQSLFVMLVSIELLFIGWLLEQGYPTDARHDEAMLNWLFENRLSISL